MERLTLNTAGKTAEKKCRLGSTQTAGKTTDEQKLLRFFPAVFGLFPWYPGPLGTF